MIPIEHLEKMILDERGMKALEGAFAHTRINLESEQYKHL